MTLSGATLDMLGDDASDVGEPRRPPRLVALAIAAAVGFGAAQVVDALSLEAPAPALALVTGREPYLDATQGDTPSTSLEVVLVNTGRDRVVLDGAEVQGSGLGWEADRPLEPGQQVTAVLREERPCEGVSARLSGRTGTPRLQVRMQDRDGAGLPELWLPLPGTAGLRCDDHVRAVCALPRLPEAVDVAQRSDSRVGHTAVVVVGLFSRSVRPLRVVEVASPVPGVRVILTDAAGRPVRLPLDLPGRSRTEIDQGYTLDDPASIRRSAGPRACVPPDTNGGQGGAATVVYVDPDDLGQIPERPVFADLAGLLTRSCS